MMLLALYLGLCAVVAVAANQSGRSGVGFFFLALIFSPIIGFIVLACIGRRQPPQPQVIQVLQVVHVGPDGQVLRHDVIEHHPTRADDAGKLEWERRFLGSWRP